MHRCSRPRRPSRPLSPARSSRSCRAVWRSATLLAATVAALVAASVAVADPLDPKIDIRDADQAAAARVLIKQSDLGAGWTGGPVRPTSLKMPRCPQQSPSFHDLTMTG